MTVEEYLAWIRKTKKAGCTYLTGQTFGIREPMDRQSIAPSFAPIGLMEAPCSIPPKQHPISFEHRIRLDDSLSRL
jgi:hypothetical protein